MGHAHAREPAGGEQLAGLRSGRAAPIRDGRDPQDRRRHRRDVARVYQGWTEPSRWRNEPDCSGVSESTSATISAAAGPGSSSSPLGVAMAVRRRPGWRATAMIAVVAQAPGELDRDHVERRLRRHVADVAPDRGGDLHRADGRGHVHDPRPGRLPQRIEQGPGQQHRADGVDPDLVEDVLGAQLQHVALVVGHAEGPSVDPGVVDQHVDGRIRRRRRRTPRSMSPTRRRESSTWSVSSPSSPAAPGRRQPAHTSSPRAA